ncbi:hypothetical protein ACIGBL_34175 [Streptomyces sp. NPDC085614]|uniref:hypothetical protein n=1 Tax=Streptomyces sp. NPDC085614 TaxID=3365733 RepID=UPI0037D6779A
MAEKNIDFGERGIKGSDAIVRQLDQIAGDIATPRYPPSERRGQAGPPPGQKSGNKVDAGVGGAHADPESDGDPV